MKSNKPMFWWGGGLFILLVFLFVSQYFGNANHRIAHPCRALYGIFLWFNTFIR